MSDEDALHELDVLFARKVFDPAVEVYLAEKQIKAEELAEKMGVDRHYFSKMRHGQKPIAGRHLLALGDCPPAVVKLEEPLNEDANLEPPRERVPIVLTIQDLKDEAYEMAIESEPLRFSLAHRVAQRKGVRPEYVMSLLKK